MINDKMPLSEKMILKTLFTGLMAWILTLVTGCTLVPVTASLDVPAVKTASSTGPVVKVTSVTDNRKFVYPHVAGDCETPSVDSEKMLNDAYSKARSFGRQGRCDGGEWANHAMVMLPDGQTVANSVQAAVEDGLIRAGYRINNQDPSAIPVSVALNNFWVAFSLDGMGMRYSYTYDIDVKTPLGQEKYKRMDSEKMYFAAGSKWAKYAQLGLEQLSTEVSNKQKPL